MNVLTSTFIDAINQVECLLADDTVHADLDLYYSGRDVVVIYSWSSSVRGKGNTNKALAELREKGEWISVCNIGVTPEDESWQYWLHQFEAGRVDELTDSEGEIVKTRG